MKKESDWESLSKAAKITCEFEITAAGEEE